MSRPPPRLLAVGRMRPGGPEAALFAEYNKRLRPPLAVTEIAEAARAASPSEARRREGAALLAALPEGALLVALDLGGAAPSSEELRRAVGALGRERADTLLRGRRRRGARPRRAGRRRAPPVARAADLAAPARARPLGGAAFPRAIDPRRPSLPPRMAAVRGLRRGCFDNPPATGATERAAHGRRERRAGLQGAAMVSRSEAPARETLPWKGSVPSRSPRWSGWGSISASRAPRCAAPLPRAWASAASASPSPSLRWRRSCSWCRATMRRPRPFSGPCRSGCAGCWRWRCWSPSCCSSPR